MSGEFLKRGSKIGELFGANSTNRC